MTQTYKNEVHLTGELAKEPDARFTASGKKVCTLSLVTKYKQRPEYHRVICWEDAADKAEGLPKGAFVRIVGRLQTRSWDDKQSGQKKYLTEVVAFQLVIPSEEPEPLTPDSSQSGTGAARAILAPSATTNIHGVPITDDDIPF